ncbi:MAG: 5'/3'-nucleotidase SurE [Thermoguttaceae bacterium]
MLILLTNDDSVHSPALFVLERELARLGQVVLVAPATEQSGVGHSITFRYPLLVREVLRPNQSSYWAVEGTPADCVKFGVTKICPQKPDLIVSGINNGLNAGINILYSGTVAAAVEATLYGIDSFAVSMEYCEHGPFDEQARIAVSLIEKILGHKRQSHLMSEKKKLFNINIPRAALGRPPRIKTAPMDPNPYWDEFERRVAPIGQEYFWLFGKPIPKNSAPSTSNADWTDLEALGHGCVTVTPLEFDRTDREALQTIQDWEW